MQYVLDQVDFDWYDRFFGPRHGSTFHVYANILIGPANYAEEAYGEAVLVLNETFVEACVMRYLMSHPFDFSENTDHWIEMLGIDEAQLSAAPDRIKYIQDAYLQLLIDIDYNQKRFYMIKDVIEALAEREQQTSKYPTMYDFMIKQAGLCEIHDRGQKRNVPFCSADVSSFQTATNAINIPFFMNR